MAKATSPLSILAAILTTLLLWSVSAQNPSPWFLGNVATVPLTAADAVIIDAVFDSTRLVVLDSYFRLRYFTYTSTSASLSKTVDISPKMGQGIVGSSYPTNRYDKTAALRMNPTTGEIFVATYSPFTKSKFSLNIHIVRSDNTVDSLVYDSADDSFFTPQYKNPRIKLFCDGTNNLYVGFFNYPDGNAKGIWLARHPYDGISIKAPNIKKPSTSSNAFTIDFKCKSSAAVCIWTTSRAVAEYTMPNLGNGPSYTTTSASPELQFDPETSTNGSDSYFFHHLLNDTSRFILHSRDQAYASLGASISPYIVSNAFDQSNFDIQVDGQQIYVGFTSALNSSLSLGNSEIVISQYNASYQLQSSFVLSTARIDSLTRLLPVSGNKLMVVGMTEGDLSNPTINAGSRRVFVAHFQYFWITSLQTASSGSVRGGESFLIVFSGFPNSATTGTPSVTLNGRACTVRGWVGQNLNVTAPYGIGGPHELKVVFSYLPFTPSVTNRTLSYPPPVLQSINVTQGPAVGYPIRLTVDNLGLMGQDAILVTVAGRLCKSINQTTVSQITCVTPPGTGTYNPVVVSAGTNLISTQSFNLSYNPPTFYQIAPISGPSSGGNEVALYGANFGPCASMPCDSANHKVSVTIGGLSCVNPFLWEDNLVRCLAPQGIGVGHPIRVFVDGQQGTNDSVTYAYDIPRIAMLVPSTSVSNIPTVYIEGENFGFNASVVAVLFTETVNGTVYPCDNLILKSNINIRCDFSSTQLPNDATFNITVVVANQSSIMKPTSQFRTGVSNSYPVVSPYTATVDEDSILVVVLKGNDPDLGDSITFFISATPIHGNIYQFSSSALNSKGPIIDTSLSPVAVQDSLARLVYIPFQEFSGEDYFTFLGRDKSNAESNVGFGNITVNPVADAPIPKSLNIEIDEDNATVINFDVQDSDSPDSTLRIILLSIPPFGKGELYEVDDLLNRESEIASAPYNVSNFRKRVLYVPPSNVHGFYFTAFTYQAADESQLSFSNASVVMSINSVNDFPTAKNKSYVMLEDNELTITFECEDPDVEDRFMIQIETVPSAEAGTLFQTDLRYQAPIYPGDRLSRLVAQFAPSENYFGHTSFSFRCLDNVSASDAAIMDIEVRNVNDIPLAPSLSVVIDEDTDAIIEIPLSDIETPSENLTIIIMDLPRRGILHYPQMVNSSIIWIPINDTGFIVPNYNRTLMFRPPPDANGDPYAVFPYVVDDGSDQSSNNGIVTIIINAANDPPYLERSSISGLSVEEDGELTITMNVRDPDYDGRLSVKVTDLRINGSLYHVNRQTGGNSRLVVGEGSEIAGPPYQVIYVPAKDFASTSLDTFQRFNVSFVDSGTNNVTNSEEIVFPVVPVNDAPKIDCSSPYIVLPQENLIFAFTVAEFQLLAYDIDDTDLEFYVSSLPVRGTLKDGFLGHSITINTPFKSSKLIFNSSGTAGGYPYGNFTIYAKDPHGSESARCTFQFTVNCPPGLVNNILRNTGPICVTCPQGAVCSQDGTTPARSRPGFWLSDDKMTFLPCLPKEACPGTAENKCAPGYKGIRCGQCGQGYYKLANLCQKCPTDVAMKLFIVAGILALAGVLLLLFVRYSKGPILGLFGILVNFLQSIILLQHLRIEWPQEFYDLLSRLSIVNINVEIASPECFATELTFDFSLRLKIALMSPLLLGGIAILYFLIARMIRILYHQLRPSLVRSSDKTGVQQLGRVLHTLLNILYVHVTTSSLSLFDCYQSPDGHHYLEADSSLRCYEAWYVQDMPYAIIGTCIYVVGIPLYFSAVYFILHQTRYTSKFWQKSKQTLEELMTFDKNYKREYQFYGVLQLYHKLAVILVNVFLTRYASIQIVFTVGLLLLWLQLFILYRPYIHDTLNRLEVLSHISIILVLGAGLPFRFDELVSGSSLQQFFVVFIIFIICGFIVLVLVAALGEVWGKLGSRQKEKTTNQSKNMYQSSVQILLPTKP